MKTELLNPSNFNLMVSRLGDVLVKAIDKPLGYAINWGRVWSLLPVHLETACCSVEFGAASGPRYDVEKFGIIEAFGSLRQCDLIVVQGTVTRKMAPRLRMVYDQGIISYVFINLYELVKTNSNSKQQISKTVSN